MITPEFNNAVIVKQQEVLENALSTNPKTQKILQNLIRQVILEARANVVNRIQFTHGDPRGARRAVRSSVYKRLLGANINIFNSRKAHGSTDYEPIRTLRPGQIGGNRRKRSPNTERMMRYEGHDRGFILRWLNAGTGKRSISSGGNRGSITGRNWFAPTAGAELMKAAETLAQLIEREFNSIMDSK